MKKIIEITSFIVILGGSISFGFLDQPVQMGLAIVAGAISISLVNLEKFKKIKGAGFEAELIEKIEAVIEKETESVFSGEDGKPVPDISQIGKDIRSVIDALRHHQYTWRYLGGIKQDTKLSIAQIQDSIKWLIEHGYVKQSLGAHGKIWNLTEDGRYLHTVIAFEHI